MELLFDVCLETGLLLLIFWNCWGADDFRGMYAVSPLKSISMKGIIGNANFPFKARDHPYWVNCSALGDGKLVQKVNLQKEKKQFVSKFKPSFVGCYLDLFMKCLTYINNRRC